MMGTGIGVRVRNVGAGVHAPAGEQSSPEFVLEGHNAGRARHEMGTAREGHDFSRAARMLQVDAALAAEVRFKLSS